LFFGQVQAAPEISAVTTTYAGSAAQVSWVGADQVDVYGANFEYGPTINYGLTSTIRVAAGVTDTGVRYYFSSTIKDIAEQSTVYYKITVYNTSGDSTVFKDSFTMPHLDTKPPVISKISVAAQSESVTISWVTDEPADCRVEYETSSGPKSKYMQALVTEHHVFIGDLRPNTAYTYRIESADKDGNTSSDIERKFTTAGLFLPPNDVIGLRMAVKDGQMILTWRNPVQTDFDHVTIVRSPGSPAASPDDGEELYRGTKESFTGPVPKAKYYYTVFSFNRSGRNSGGSTLEIGANGSSGLPGVTVSSSQRISLSKLRFYTSRRSEQLNVVNGTITDKAQANFSIGVPLSILPYPPELIVVRISGGEMHQFSLPSGQNNYFTDFLFPSGRNSAYVEINYANGLRDVVSFQMESIGQEELPPPPLPQKAFVPPAPKESSVVIAPIKETAEAIKDFAANEQVQQTVSAVVAPTVVGVVAVTTVTTVSWVNLLPFLQLLLFQPFVLMGRKRRFSYGQVYDSLNKLPIDLAVVRLINKKTGTLAQSKVTDKEGRYAFVVGPGTYAIQVIKNGFLFPSRLMHDAKVDGQKVDIYHGEALSISGSDAVIASNIPLDPAGQYHKPPARLFWQTILRRVQIVFSWVGLAVILFSLYVSPKWYTWLLLVVHLFSLLILRRLVSPRKQKNWGIIYDAKTRQPIIKVVARLYNAHLNRLVATQITDAKGRYFFLAGDDTYYLTFEHPSYAPAKTEPINLKGKRSESIAVDFGLKPQSAS
jgi:hypothetical protein